MDFGDNDANGIIDFDAAIDFGDGNDVQIADAGITVVETDGTRDQQVPDSNGEHYGLLVLYRLLKVVSSLSMVYRFLSFVLLQ